MKMFGSVSKKRKIFTFQFMNEAQFTTKFQKWLKHNHWGLSFPCEAKRVKDGCRLNFKSDIKDHQIECLYLAKHKQLVHKISDLDQLSFKPFDGFLFTDSPAYFIVYWYRKGNKEFFIIDIDAIINEINDGMKSLTEDRAREIAYKIGQLA